jgi:hypothetical protein
VAKGPNFSRVAYNDAEIRAQALFGIFAALSEFGGDLIAEWTHAGSVAVRVAVGIVRSNLCRSAGSSSGRLEF